MVSREVCLGKALRMVAKKCSSRMILEIRPMVQVFSYIGS